MIRFQNCLWLLWFWAARFKNACNYYCFERYEWKHACDYNCFEVPNSQTLTITVACAIRLPNCLWLLWFWAARLQNAHNYYGFERYDFDIACDYCGVEPRDSNTLTITLVLRDTTRKFIMITVVSNKKWDMCIALSRTHNIVFHWSVSMLRMISS